MKKLSLLSLFFVALFAITSCKKEENNANPDNSSGGQLTVEKKQRSIFIDFTATWCGPCGQWGIPNFKQGLQNGGDKVVGFAVHAAPPQTSELVAYFNKPNNDTLFVAPLLNDLLANVNGLTLTGWPTLWLNNIKVSNNQTTIANEINSKSAQEPAAGVALKVSRTSNGFTVETGTKFFKADNGEYFHTVLVTEDDIINRQNLSNPGSAANYNNSFEHDHITRGPAINSTDKTRPSTFGDGPIATGAVTEGKYVGKTYTFTSTNFTNVPAGINVWTWNPAKSHVVVILWKKNANGKYDFVNIAQSSI